MEILKSANVNWNRAIKCPKCYSIFSITADDIEIWFDSTKMETLRLTICPECWERISLGVEWTIEPKKENRGKK